MIIFENTVLCNKQPDDEIFIKVADQDFEDEEGRNRISLITLVLFAVVSVVIIISWWILCKKSNGLGPPESDKKLAKNISTPHFQFHDEA